MTTAKPVQGKKKRKSRVKGAGGRKCGGTSGCTAGLY